MPNFFKKNKKPLTYEEAHNKAFSRYRKAAQIMIWAGALNVIGLIVALIQLNSETKTFSPFLCFSTNNLCFRLMMFIPGLESINFLWYFLCIIIAIIFGAGMAACGVFAQQGKKIPLFIGLVFYTIDMFTTISLNFVGESTANLWLISGIHVIIIVFLAIAVYEYFNIIKLAIKHNKIKE